MAHTHQEDEPATLPCRAYQQVDLLNSLQSYMLTPRTPCGHASRLKEQTPHLSTSTMNPMVMSYLASSRLSSLPASFDIFAQVRKPRLSVSQMRLLLHPLSKRCDDVSPVPTR